MKEIIVCARQRTTEKGVKFYSLRLGGNNFNGLDKWYNLHFTNGAATPSITKEGYYLLKVNDSDIWQDTREEYLDKDIVRCKNFVSFEFKKDIK